MVCDCGVPLKVIVNFVVDSKDVDGCNYTIHFLCEQCQEVVTHNINIYKYLSKYLNVEFEILCACMKLSKDSTIYLEVGALFEYLRIPSDQVRSITHSFNISMSRGAGGD